jgi:hypothetical protein
LTLTVCLLAGTPTTSVGATLPLSAKVASFRRRPVPSLPGAFGQTLLPIDETDIDHRLSDGLIPGHKGRPALLEGQPLALAPGSSEQADVGPARCRQRLGMASGQEAELGVVVDRRTDVHAVEPVGSHPTDSQAASGSGVSPPRVLRSIHRWSASAGTRTLLPTLTEGNTPEAM